MLNLKRTVTSGAVGAASGALNPGLIGNANDPNSGYLVFGTTRFQYSTLVEAAAFLGGAALQLLSPMTVPEIVDGAVDGGLALLAKRGTENVLKGNKTLVAPMFGAQMNPMLGMGSSYPAQSFAESRAQVGGLGNLRKYTLS